MFGDEERKEVNEVLETGILMRYGLTAHVKEGGKRGNSKKRSIENSVQSMRSLCAMVQPLLQLHLQH